MPLVLSLAMGTAGMYIETDGKEYLLTPVDTVPGYYVCLDTSMVVEYLDETYKPISEYLDPNSNTVTVLLPRGH